MSRSPDTAGIGCALKTLLNNLGAQYQGQKNGLRWLPLLAGFAGMADVIEDGAITGDDAQFVSRRLDEILAWHGLENGDRDC